MAKLILNDTTVGLGGEFKPSDGMWFTVKHPVGKAVLRTARNLDRR